MFAAFDPPGVVTTTLAVPADRAGVVAVIEVGVTTLNLRVVQTDVERGLVLVEGAVPGAAGGWIFIRDAIKKALPKDAPLPGKFRVKAAAEAAAETNQEG